jgi:enoyl-CoA hydratase/carnithine racemase
MVERRTDGMNFENVEFALHDTIALIRLAKSFDSANTLGTSSLRELRAAAASASRNRTVRLLMVTGRGRTFSAGADIREIDACENREVLAFLREGQALLQQIMDLNVITIAAVNGLALGGGMELALACDIRWAHARAVFGLPEAKLGLLPGWGALSLLRGSAPASLGVEMVVSGEFISARRAYESGLVSRLFKERDFEAAALAQAGNLADSPAGTLREIKAALRCQRRALDLSAGDRSFLKLWNIGHDRPEKNHRDNGRRRK